MNSATAGSKIVDFFQNKSVLITGVTGFIGKMILLKLLQSCRHISHITVLIREKKGRTVAERLSEILNTEPFQQLFKTWPDARGRVSAVSGDITKAELGLSSKDFENLCNAVCVIIHAAASVRFDEPIQKAMETNVQGLSHMLQLATKIKRLQAFVHISTAYSNCNRAAIDEVIYPTSTTPQAVFEMVTGMTEEEAAGVTPKLLEGRPNTYTFTKSLAEQLADSYRKQLPICIVRPSIVSAAHRQPFPGWIDSWNGVTAVIGFVLHGFQRFVHMGSRSSKLDLIPVDHVVNLTIAAAWFTATASNTGTVPYFIYNCCSGGSNPISSAKIIKYGLKAAWETPFPKAFRFPSVSVVTNRWLYTFYDAVFHRLLYQFMDLKAVLCSETPRMTKFYHKMAKTVNVLDFFATSEFNFCTENTKKLQGHLNVVDKELFNFDIDTIQWEPFMQNCIAGIRRYLLHEAEDQLDVDRARYKRLYVVHWAIRGAAASLLIVLAVLTFVSSWLL